MSSAILADTPIPLKEQGGKDHPRGIDVGPMVDVPGKGRAARRRHSIALGRSEMPNPASSSLQCFSPEGEDVSRPPAKPSIYRGTGHLITVSQPNTLLSLNYTNQSNKAFLILAFSVNCQKLCLFCLKNSSQFETVFI